MTGMLGTRLERAPSLTQSMRSALARAELAASELARDAATPRARRLARAVSGAVADVDLLVSELVLLLTGNVRRHSLDDLRPVLSALRERFAASLEARDILWPVDGSTPPPVDGNPELARRAGVALLRWGAAALPAGGRLSLAARAEPGGWGLDVRLDPQPTDTEFRLSSPAFEELNAFAIRLGARLEHEQPEAPSGVSLRLCFPFPESACAAS